MSTKMNNWFFMDGRFYGGLAAGAVLLAALGFNWVGDFGFDWVLGSTAQQDVKQSVQARLSELCVARAQQDEDAENQLAALKKESAWKRDDFVAERGWSKFAPSGESESGVADACAKELVEAAT